MGPARGGAVLWQHAYNVADQISDEPFEHDDSGNLTEGKRPGESGTWTYTYDMQNRIVEAESASDTYTYTYDGDGARVDQDDGSTVTEYLVDPLGGLPEVVAEVGSGNSLDALYTRGRGLISRHQPDNAGEALDACGLSDPDYARFLGSQGGYP